MKQTVRQFRSEGEVCRFKDILTTMQTYHPPSFRADHVSHIVSSIIEIIEDDSDAIDDSVIKFVSPLIVQAYLLLHQEPPLPSVVPDGDRGIRIEWAKHFEEESRRSEYVRLIVPVDLKESYIYKENYLGYDALRGTTSPELLSWTLVEIFGKANRVA